MKKIYNLIVKILDLMIFIIECDYWKNDIFFDKFINTTYARSRIKYLKQFLYFNVKIILKTERREDFFNLILKPFLNMNYREVNVSLYHDNIENPVYFMIFYRLPLEETFGLFSQVLYWEHVIYPNIFEDFLFYNFMHREIKMLEFNKALQYYIQFLDILTGNEIESIFDLEALKYSIQKDQELFNYHNLYELSLFRDWKIQRNGEFDDRFPEFKGAVLKKQQFQIV